jgi:penicillin-binding protein 1A
MVKKKIAQGGSTITQQLVKIVLLSPERTIKRKVQEVLLSLLIEKRFSKEEILAIYMNRVYMGAGIYGVSGAAYYYLGKNIKEINLYEAAMIAGLIKAPSRYNPSNSDFLIGSRTYQILKNMRNVGFISDAQLEEARDGFLNLNTSNIGSLKNFYFTDWTVEQVNDLGKKYANKDLTIRTTLNLDIQTKVEKVTGQLMHRYSKIMNAGQVAVIVMDTKGMVLAMLGGTDYYKSQFNRATKAKRQPGSIFKSVVYIVGLESGMTPNYEFLDTPISIGNWHPRNYNRKYLGSIPLNQAFIHSINTVAVQLSEKIGRKKVVYMAKTLGINSPLSNHPSVALGTSEVSLLEMMTLYGTLANDGKLTIPRSIMEIRDDKKNVLYKYDSQDGRRVISPNTVYHMKEMLKGVIREGSGIAAKIDNLTTYGKTGTSQDFRDAWFIGFTDNYVIGVWVGNDDNSAMNKVTGGTLPAYIWKEIMIRLRG